MFYIILSKSLFRGFFFVFTYIILEAIVKFQRKHQKALDEIYIYTHYQKIFSQIKEYTKWTKTINLKKNELSFFKNIYL